MKLNQDLIGKLSRGEVYTKLESEDQTPLLKEVLKAAFLNKTDVQKIDTRYLDYLFGESKKYQRQWACGRFVEMGGEQIPLQDFSVEKNLTISRSNLQTIYNKVCCTWKDRLEELVVEDLFADSYEIPLFLLRQVYKESDSEVKALLEKHFGKANCVEEVVFEKGKTYITAHGTIVMCTDPEGEDEEEFTGVCLQRAKGVKSEPVGQLDNDWYKNSFKPFKGVIGFY